MVTLQTFDALRANTPVTEFRFQIELLEDRILLATVDVIAGGTTGQEQIQLQIDGVAVSNWNDLGNGALNGEYVVRSYTADSTVNAGQVQIQFLNDLYLPEENIDRNVRIDAIVIDGVRFEAEDPNVFSTGTWKPADGIQPGFREDEFLHTDGFFLFSDPVSDPTDDQSVVRIRARGDEGGERFTLAVDGQLVGAWQTTTEFQEYQFVANRIVDPTDIRVEFVNDLWQPANDVDRNLIVDYVDLDGTIYQTEHPSVYSTGTWISGQGIVPGLLQTQVLHANGYFQFNAQNGAAEYRAYVETLNGVLPDGWNTQIVDDGIDIRLRINNPNGETEFDVRLGSAGVISDLVDHDTGQDMLAPSFQGESTDRVLQWTLWETGTNVVHDVPSLPDFEDRFNMTQAGTFEDVLSDTVDVTINAVDGYVDIWAIVDDQWKSEQDPHMDANIYSLTRIQALDQGGLLVRRVIKIGEIQLNGQTTTLERAYLEAWSPFADQEFNSLALSIDEQGIPDHWYADSVNIPFYPATDVDETRGWAVVYDRFDTDNGNSVAIVFGQDSGEVHLADGTTLPTQKYVLNSMDFNGGLAVLPGLVPGEVPMGTMIDTSIVVMPSPELGTDIAIMLDALAGRVAAPDVYHPEAQLPDELSIVAERFNNLANETRIATDHLSDLT